MTVQTILIVDDNEIDRFLHEAVIHSVYPDITVLQAGDGLHALEILRDVTADLILLDVNMPQMDGLAFLENLGKSGEIPPVFMLSSTYRDTDKEGALAYGAVKDCLVKPLTPAMVGMMVKT